MDSKLENVKKMEMKERLLIQLVQSEPFLYDASHEYYRNVGAKERTWQDIGHRTDWTAQQCRAKWKGLRDQYSRELKRLASNPNSGAKWRHFDSLTFLTPHTSKRKASSGRRNKKRKAEEFPSEAISTTTFVITQQHDQQQLPQQQLSSQQQQEQQSVMPCKSEEWEIFADAGGESPEIYHEQQMMEQKHMIQQEISNHGQNQEAEDDDDSIHVFLKIEGYFEKELIGLVKMEPCLYNKCHGDYRNQSLKVQKWELIAKKLSRTVKQCRLKWKALRDQYSRESRRIRLKTYKSNGILENFPRWRHFDALDFLEPYIQERRSIMTRSQDDEMDITNYILEEEENEAAGNSTVTDYSLVDQTIETRIEAIDTEPLSPPHMQPANEDDEIGAFFRAVAMKVRNAKMSPVSFTEIQIEILRVINNKLRNSIE